MQTVHWEKMFVTIDGGTVEIEVPSELNYPTSVRIGGKEIPVDFTRVDGSFQWLLRSMNETFPLTVQHTYDGLAVHARGWDFDAKVEDERTQQLKSLLRTTQGVSGTVAITAPMPGLVIRLLKNTGDPVKHGEPYMILEAMKMENELPAALKGNIKQVHVNAGQTVEKGATLITIEVEN